jgi:hypothetical protein
MVARIRTMKVRLPSCERKKVSDREGEEEENEEERWKDTYDHCCCGGLR